MQRENHNFINAFIAFATAKLNLAIISIVTSDIVWTPLSPREVSFPCCTDAGGGLSLQTATMLDTIMMICARFSLSVGEGVGARTRFGLCLGIRLERSIAGQ
jgi:hypothetical protein